MDFDLFLEDIKKKTPKSKKRASNQSAQKVKQLLENAILDDKCTEMPQTNHGRRVYK